MNVRDGLKLCKQSITVYFCIRNCQNTNRNVDIGDQITRFQRRTPSVAGHHTDLNSFPRHGCPEKWFPGVNQNKVTETVFQGNQVGSGSWKYHPHGVFFFNKQTKFKSYGGPQACIRLPEGCQSWQCMAALDSL